MNEKAYVDSFRSHTQSGELKVSGKKSATAEAEGANHAAEARVKLEKEYEVFKVVMEVFGSDTTNLDETTEDLFFTEYAKRVCLFSVLSERAERKGLLPAKLGSLSDKERDNVYDELSTDYRKIIGEIGGSHLSKQIFTKNPVLFQGHEVYVGLKVDFPDIPPYLILEFALLNQSDPRGACERYEANYAELKGYQSFLDGTPVPNYIYQNVASSYPTRANGVMEELDLAYSEAVEEHPDVARSIILTIARSNLGNREAILGEVAKYKETVQKLHEKHQDKYASHILQTAALDKNPAQWLELFDSRVKSITESYPELSSSFVNMIASRHRTSYLEKAEQVVEDSYVIMEKFGINLSFAMQISLRHKEALEAADEIIKKVDSALENHPGLTRRDLLMIAISGSENFEARLEQVENSANQMISQFPNLPPGLIKDFVLRFSENKLAGALQKFHDDVTSIQSRFPDISQSEINQLVRRNWNEDVSQETLIEGVVSYQQAVQSLVDDGLNITLAKMICIRSYSDPYSILEKVYAAEDAIKAVYPDLRPPTSLYIAVTYTSHAVEAAARYKATLAIITPRLQGASEEIIDYLASRHPNPDSAVEAYFKHYANAGRGAPLEFFDDELD